MEGDCKTQNLPVLNVTIQIAHRKCLVGILSECLTLMRGLPTLQRPGPYLPRLPRQVRMQPRFCPL